MWTTEILGAGGVEQPQAHREGERLAVVVEAQRRERGHPVLEADLLAVDLGDEELHPALHVGAEHGLGALGDLVVVLVQPGVEAGRVLRGEHHHVVLADGELRLDAHAEVARGRHRGRRQGRRFRIHDPGPVGLTRRRTGILLPVFDEARGGEGVDVVEELARERLDVLLLQHDRHRHHHGEVGGGPLVVVLHREHGARALAHHHHHGGVVEELGVGAADVEPAERARVARSRGPCRERGAEGQGDRQLRSSRSHSPRSSSARAQAGRPARREDRAACATLG